METRQTAETKRQYINLANGIDPDTGTTIHTESTQATQHPGTHIEDANKRAAGIDAS